MKLNMTLKEYRAIPDAKHVSALNMTGEKTAGIVMDAGMRCLCLAKDKPHDLSLRKHLIAKGVDPKKANQNGFQVARAGFLIGDDAKSQPAMKDAASVSEAKFVACPLQVLFAVSTCLNVLDRAVVAKKIEERELPGHYAKLSALIVEGNLKTAKAYQQVCKELADEGEEPDPAALPENLEGADEVIQAIGAATLAVSKVEWTKAQNDRFAAVVSALITAHKDKTAKPEKTPAKAKATAKVEPAELPKAA